MVEWLRCSTRIQQDTVLKPQYHHSWNNPGQVTHS